MAKQSINVGATANDKKGDSLRAAFQKVNANFTELYTTVGADAAGNQLVNGSQIVNLDNTGIITLPNSSYLESTDTNLKIGAQGTVTIRSDAASNITTNEWIFDTNSVLTLPTDGEVRQNSSRISTSNYIEVLGNSTTVIYTTDGAFTGCKLVITIEGQLDGDGTFTRHTQTCEATIAAIYNSSVDPAISVYGIIYTSPSPLATFDVQRGVGNSIEVVATNSQTTETLHASVHAVKFVSYYD